MKIIDNDPDIVERIRQSQEVLDASLQEIADAMTLFQSSNDETQMQELFDVYKQWELSQQSKRTVEETVLLAHKNFDIVARVADGLLASDGALLYAMRKAIDEPRARGPISEFYRNAVGYDPNASN